MSSKSDKSSKSKKCRSPKRERCEIIVPRTVTVVTTANDALLSNNLPTAVPGIIVSPTTITLPAVGVASILLFPLAGTPSVTSTGARTTVIVPVGTVASVGPPVTGVFTGLGVTTPTIGAQYNIGVSVATNGTAITGLSTVTAMLGFTPGAVTTGGVFTPSGSFTPIAPIAPLVFAGIGTPLPFPAVTGFRYDFYYTGSDTVVRPTGLFSIQFTVTTLGVGVTAATTIVPSVFDVSVTSSTTTTTFGPIGGGLSPFGGPFAGLGIGF